MLGPKLEGLIERIALAMERNADELAKLREAIVAPGDVELHVKSNPKGKKA